MADKKQNPFPYATDPELNRMFDTMVDLQARVAAQFAKAEKIAGFTSTKFTPLTDAKITLPNYRSIREPNVGAWNPKPLPMTAVDEQVEDAVAIAKKHLDEVDEINKPILESNQKIRSQVYEMMTRLGIGETYTTYDYPSPRSKTKKSSVHSSGYIGDLNRIIPKSNVQAERYKLETYLREYATWKKVILEAEQKAKVEKDEEIVRTKILGNPTLVQVLMQAGVNILQEVQNAVPGKKGEVIQFCIAQAHKNVKEYSNPDFDLLSKIEELHHDF